MTRDGDSPSGFYILDGYLSMQDSISCKSILIIMMKPCHKFCRKNVNEMGPNIKLYENVVV